MDNSRYISEKLSISSKGVSTVISLINDGATIPFIARYRKEATGELSEINIREIADLNIYLLDLNKRKETILSEIKSQNRLTESINRKILECTDKQKLEAIYLPFKPKKTTKVDRAKDAKLDNLAKLISTKIDISEIDINNSISKLNSSLLKKQNYNSRDEIILGAIDIAAYEVSQKEWLRSELSDRIERYANITTSPKKEWREKESKFSNYYCYSTPITRVKPHALLAILRGEKEKVLSVKLDYDKDRLINRVESELTRRDTPSVYQTQIAKEAFKRYLAPQLENSILSIYKEIAYKDGVSVFATNISKLLLAPPAGSKRILAIDPGFRTGCKCVIIDENQNYIENCTIYPVPPKNLFDESAFTLKKLIEKYDTEIIAVGNGTGGRETESFIKKYLYPIIDKKPIVVTANESGASVYSASKTAIEEFPNLDVTIRGAISIGRRVQDPLTELIKIDPKSIGVGQYQHDLPSKELQLAIDRVVESAVNSVGADINLASIHLLNHISGITPTMAKNIVQYRKVNGKFRTRNEIKKVKGIGSRAFEQAAGFLRIIGGEDPLDNSAVHPESYPIAKSIINSFDKKESSAIGNKELLDNISPLDFTTENAGVITVTDILEELKKPARDPRKEFTYASFSERINSISDLVIAQKLEGVVTNVTNFGAFVDIGVHQDGLVHISQLADKFVSNPNTIVSTGDIVTVYVLEIDEKRKRISLSMKNSST